MEQRGALAAMQALETKSDDELSAREFKAAAQAILGARAAERYDATAARDPLPHRDRRRAPAGAPAAAAHGRRLAGAGRAPARRPQEGRRAPRPGRRRPTASSCSCASWALSPRRRAPPGRSKARGFAIILGLIVAADGDRLRCWSSSSRCRSAEASASVGGLVLGLLLVVVVARCPGAARPAPPGQGARGPRRAGLTGRAAGPMCGRYSLAGPNPAVLRERFALGDDVPVRRRFNVAPGDDVLSVTTSREGERRADVLRWGLVPHWAKDPKTGFKMINARAETVAGEARLPRRAAPAGAASSWPTDSTSGSRGRGSDASSRSGSREPTAPVRLRRPVGDVARAGRRWCCGRARS